MFEIYVRKNRLEQHLSQEQLAEKVGIDQSVISRIEQDNSIRKQSISLAKIIKISHALCVCPNKLIHYPCKECPQYQTCMDEDKENLITHNDYEKCI